MEPAQNQGGQPVSTPANNRTIAKDIAKLIKANKLSKKDLASLDNDLRAQAISYASTLEDESLLPLNIRKHPVSSDHQGPIDPTLKLRQTSPQKSEVKAPPPPKPKPAPPPPPAKPKMEETTPPPPPLNSEESINASLKSLAIRKDLIDRDMQGLMTEKNDLLHSLEMVKSQEREVEEEERRIRMELNESHTAEEKRALEEQRWSLEDKRQVFEKNRWETRRKEDELGKKIQSKRKDQNDILDKQKELEDSLKKLNLKKEADKARKTLAEQQAEHSKILSRKKKYESDWTMLGNVISALEQKIEEKKKLLKEANKDFEEIEKKEQGSDDERERHKLEERRWEADKTLRETEKEVWASEEEMNKKLAEKKDLEQTFASIQIEEEDILDKMQESKALIHRAEKVS